MDRRNFLLSLVGMGVCFDPSHCYQVERVKIPNKTLAGLRILALSDIHISSFFMPNWSAFSFDFNQDLTVLLGDYYYIRDSELRDHKLKSAMIKNFHELLECLTSLSPLVGVRGNHDIKHYYLDTPGFFKRYGGVFLINQSFNFQKINLYGSDDFLTGYPGVPDKADLVLTHSPDYFCYSLIKTNLKCITLAGHTHGGQIRIFKKSFVLNIGCTKYLSGYYEEPWGQLYVTRGLGMVGIPVRINCPPEITVIDFV
ncbi:MAG: metallophosphoesterase [Deltaproteobacteria bacterium]|nr:metallophosphoesterase [Deltaproteobacteria bacterium]